MALIRAGRQSLVGVMILVASTSICFGYDYTFRMTNPDFENSMTGWTKWSFGTPLDYYFAIGTDRRHKRQHDHECGPASHGGSPASS